MIKKIWITAAKRTPFGTFGGTLKNYTATQLGVFASEAALNQLPDSRTHIDHVVFGNVMQSSADAAYLARHVGLYCGLNQSVPAVTLNRLCGSGFESCVYASYLIRCEEASAVLAGGAESMSQAPYVLRQARFGYRMNHSMLEDSLLSGLKDAYIQMAMAETAEGLALDYKITKAQCDEYALRSHQLASQAIEQKLFEQEIIPISISQKNQTTLFSTDEHVRKDTSLEALSKLKPVFKPDGVISAGNASGMGDGAGALILASSEKCNSLGWEPLGEWIGSSVVGCDPKRMGLGPVYATQKLLNKLKLSLNDLAIIEMHEAFAPQYLAVEKSLELDRKKTNLQGGAIALSHPFAASGARQLAHLLYSLKKRGGGYGLCAACIGGGQGLSVVVKV